MDRTAEVWTEPWHIHTLKVVVLVLTNTHRRRVLPGVLSYSPASVPSASASSSSFVSRAGEAFPGLCDRLDAVPAAVRGELLGQLTSTCLQWACQVRMT